MERLYSNLDIVNKMIGSIVPIGESNTDEQRFDNLKEMCELVECLISQLETIRTDKNEHQFSIKRSGEYVDRFLNSLQKPTNE